jgi:hypothetical protein
MVQREGVEIVMVQHDGVEAEQHRVVYIQKACIFGWATTILVGRIVHIKDGE